MSKELLDISVDEIGAVSTDILMQQMEGIIADKGLTTTNDPAPINKEPLQQKQESKTRRVQLLMRPSTVTILQAKAKVQGISFNELVNLITEQYIKG